MLLNVLRDSQDKYVSGTELAARLGVSRTTVWNHIHYLEEQGYSFDASTKLGYKLTAVPDRMLPGEIASGLHTRWLGRKIKSCQEIDSTNDLAMRLAADGSPTGSVIFAEHQRKGKGRLHRKWHSPPKRDLLFSIILRPAIHPRKVTQLTIASAVGTALAVRETFELPALIKWPNDIYINDRKCAGILIEMSAELDTIEHVVVGIGMNVNSNKSDFPGDVVSNATSLSIELGRKCNRVQLACRLLEKLESQYDRLEKEGFDAISREWNDLSLTLGRRVEAVCDGETISGTPVRLDDDGSLLVRVDSGMIRKVSGGDIILH
jgi:BirA family biotin operon repressor/biotin-[acetyl-CoA-carboxylase] ligase